MMRKQLTIICFSVSVLLLVGGCQSTYQIEVEANQRSLKKTKTCTFCELQFADLKGADLRGANLQKANLQGANLYGANLQ